jgi:hypothetical protein
MVVAEERGVDGDHLHVHALRIHVLDPLLGREAHLGRGEAGALAVGPQEGAEPLAGLVPEAVPDAARLGGLPERARHQVGVDVDGPHAGSPVREEALDLFTS